MITFANSFEPDQTRLKVGSDLDPNCLTLRWYFLNRIFSKKLILTKISRRQKSMQNYLDREKHLCLFIHILFLLNLFPQQRKTPAHFHKYTFFAKPFPSQLRFCICSLIYVLRYSLWPTSNRTIQWHSQRA